MRVHFILLFTDGKLQSWETVLLILVTGANWDVAVKLAVEAVGLQGLEEGFHVRIWHVKVRGAAVYDNLVTFTNS